MTLAYESSSVFFSFFFASKEKSILIVQPNRFIFLTRHAIVVTHIVMPYVLHIVHLMTNKT